MILKLALAGLLAGALAGCGGDAGGSERPLVVAGAWPVADLAATLLLDEADVVDLTPPGAEPHDLELTAADLETIQRADVVLWLGPGLQPALEGAIPDGKGVDVRDFAGALRRGPAHGHDGEEPHEGEGEPHEGEEESHEGGGEGGDDDALDPHVWLDASRWADVAADLGRELGIRLDDPTLADRGLAVAASIDALDADITLALADCRRRILVTEHAAFGYFADRYGLDAHALTGLAPGSEATAPRLDALSELAEAEGLTTVFAERGGSGRLAASLASEAGLEVAELDPLERSIGLDDYETRMRANADAVAESLDCR